MNKNEMELKIMNFGDVLDNTLIVLKNNFFKIFILLLLFTLPLFITFSLINFFGDIFLVVFLGIVFLGGYFIFVKPIYEAIFINLIYYNILEKKDFKIRDSIKRVLKKIGSFTFNKVLYYILVFVMIGCFYVLISLATNIVSIFLSPLSYFFITKVNFVNSNLILNIINGFIIGLVAFILILIFSYFYFRIAFSIHSIALENYSSTEAFSRSYIMTKKSYLHVLLACFGLLAGIVFSLSMVYLTTWLYMGLSYVNLIVVVKTSILFLIPVIYTLFIVLFSVLYVSLRIRNESLDLIVRIKYL